jgi:hypothetical protein
MTKVKEIFVKMGKGVDKKIWGFVALGVVVLFIILSTALFNVSLRASSGNAYIEVNGEKVNRTEYIIEKLTDIEDSQTEQGARIEGLASDLNDLSQNFNDLKTELRQDKIDDKVVDISKYIFDMGVDTRQKASEMIDYWVSEGWMEWLNNLKEIARDEDMEAFFRSSVNNKEVSDYIVTWGRNS